MVLSPSYLRLYWKKLGTGLGPLQSRQGSCLICSCGRGPVWEQEGEVFLPGGLGNLF